MSGMLLSYLKPLFKLRRQLAHEEMLFVLGDPITTMFVVTQGELRLNRPLPHGALRTLQRAGGGELLAEASLFHQCYHCDAVANGPSEVALIPKGAFRSQLKSDSEFVMAFSNHLAVEVQRIRTRSELLSLKTVGERLNAWIALNGGYLPTKGAIHDDSRSGHRRTREVAEDVRLSSSF